MKRKTTLQEFRDGLRRTREQNERIARFTGAGLMSESTQTVKRRGPKAKPISFKKNDEEVLDEGVVETLLDSEE